MIWNLLLCSFLAIGCSCQHKTAEIENKEKIETPTPLPAPAEETKAFSIHREGRMAALTLNRKYFDPKVKAVQATYHDIFYGVFPFNEDIYIAVTDYGKNILILEGVDERGYVISTETFNLNQLLGITE